MPRVSVIIRNRNEGVYLRKVLRAVALQEFKPLEIVFIDNGSTDDSVTLAQDHGAKILSIDRFTYGGALNAGLAQATGDICILLSAHSLPLGPRFVSDCVVPFANPKVAAVRCLYAGKTADAARWIEPSILDSSSSIADVVSKGPLASGCAIRREAWLAVPFDESADAAEEKLWALEVLKRGYLIMSPCPAVYAYIKPVSARANFLKDNREVLAFFKGTGVKVGFARRGLVPGLMDVGRVVSAEAPHAALAAVARELLRTVGRLQILKAARRRGGHRAEV